MNIDFDNIRCWLCGTKLQNTPRFQNGGKDFSCCCVGTECETIHVNYRLRFTEEYYYEVMSFKDMNISVITDYYYFDTELESRFLGRDNIKAGYIELISHGASVEDIKKKVQLYLLLS